jgi:transposase-like protein
MIAMKCRRCGSENIRKNGTTPAGRQKIHCKNCNFYSTSDIKTGERESRLKTAETLQMERISQRGIARSLRMSRTTIRKNLKKSHCSDFRDSSCIRKTPRFGAG